MKKGLFVALFVGAAYLLTRKNANNTNGSTGTNGNPNVSDSIPISTPAPAKGFDLSSIQIPFGSTDLFSETQSRINKIYWQFMRYYTDRGLLTHEQYYSWLQANPIVVSNPSAIAVLPHLPSTSILGIMANDWSNAMNVLNNPIYGCHPVISWNDMKPLPSTPTTFKKFLPTLQSWYSVHLYNGCEHWYSSCSNEDLFCYPFLIYRNLFDGQYIAIMSDKNKVTKQNVSEFGAAYGAVVMVENHQIIMSYVIPQIGDWHNNTNSYTKINDQSQWPTG